MNEKKAGKMETDTEFLARLMAEGFGRVDARFDAVDARLDGVDARLDGVDARLEGIDARLDKVDIDFVEVKDRLRSLEKIQTETLDRLDSIDKKQTGTLASLDETVHRSEFVRLEHRVGALEVKRA